MPTDRYGFALSTNSATACDAYVAGVDLALSANHGSEEQFRRAIASDDGFALAHAALARTLQTAAQPEAAKAAAARARALAAGLPARERSHVNALATVIDNGGVAALAACREHLATWPRDAMVLAPCTGVFGLIGFSGRAGREAELLALLDGLADAYGDDWWFGSAHAFAEVETGDVERALSTIERSLTQHPRNANAAHIRSHVYYESGERSAGLDYLRRWWADYDKQSLLHCHLSWHIALWEMELGNAEAAWAVYRHHLHPGASSGPPINTLTDAASFLFRAELAGAPRDAALWLDVNRYGMQWFPASGVAFADVHVALAHALAGDMDALARRIDGARGKAVDIVAPLAMAFRAFRNQDWTQAAAILEPLMASHERIGGSRAQRDLIEYALVVCLLRSGRSREARDLLQTRRPRSGAGYWPIQGI